MNYILEILYFLLWIYTLVILARFVFDLTQSFVPDWEPGAFVATLANIVMALTEPPLRVLRKLIPPVRIGAIALDLSLIVLLFGIGILQRLVLLI